MQKYQSKKDPEIFAEIESRSEKFGTVMIKFVTGEKTGKSVPITESTLKRWWKKVEDEPVEKTVLDNIDYEKVNTKYPEPKKQKYIPKPESVIKYEEKQGTRYNSTLPTQEDMVETFSSVLSKINKTYIVFQNGCWLERKSGYINLYATESVWETLTNKGMVARKNGMKNTKLPVVFKIMTIDEYETVKEVLENA